MTRLRGLLTALLAILSIGLASSAQTQQNQSLTFKFKAAAKHKVQVAFFAQDRNHVWPGGGNAYNLDDSQVHEVKLSCQPGEKICYGGWVTGNAKIYWGRGAEGKQRCDNCCYACSNNTTPVINLNN
jgi:hypothetical protein